MSRRRASVWVLLGIGLLPLVTSCARAQPAEASRERMLAVAREVMASARFAALITVDSAGHPQARTVDPFAPEDDLRVWIGTDRHTRKVVEIQRDPRVTLYYFDPGASAYVTIRGRALVVTDSTETARRFKPEWEAFYPDRSTYVLIVVTPSRLEIVSERHGIVGDSVTWRPPSVEFPGR